MNKNLFKSLCMYCTVLAMAGCSNEVVDNNEPPVEETPTDKCQDGQRLCGDTCVDLNSDVAHCGSCSTSCTTAGNIQSAVCQSASCQITACVAGYKDCDGNPSNGCEKYVGDTDSCEEIPADNCKAPMKVCGDACKDIVNDANNCGECGNSCLTKGNISVVSCVESKCVIKECAAGYKDCDGNADNGCEKYVGDSDSCEDIPVDECKDPMKVCGDACKDVVNDANNCGECGNNCLDKGNVNSASCENSKCVITNCADGYKDCDGNPENGCEKQVGADGSCQGSNPPEEPTETCEVTFKYVNADTCATTGGEKDFDVYLIGEMNDWQPADGSLIMKADDKCVRTLTVSLPKGTAQKYKFFVAEWGDDSYRSDASKAIDDDKNNTTDGSCGATYEYVEKEATTIVTPGEPDPVDKGDCKATFTYYNEYTNTLSGGAADFDVYLVGSFNTEADGTWKISDVAWKMKSDGNGTHTISVDLKKDATYEYKYYVEGWEQDSWKTDAEDGIANGIAQMDACDKNFGTPKPEELPPVITDPTEENDCYATFIYTNKWTSKTSGGENDYDVYLIGSMNDWKEADSTLKMTSDGNGTHTIKVALKKGEKYTYKYYINGWGENSYHSNPDLAADNDGNAIADMNTCDQIFKYVEAPITGEEIPNPPVTPGSDCWLKSVPSVNGKNISFQIACSDSSATISDVKGGVNPSANGLTVTDTVTENSKYSYQVTVGDTQVFVPVWVEDKKFDWHDAVLYFAFTDRFNNGDTSNDNPKTNASVQGSANAQWLGGDFKGMQKKVEDGYFDKLGVNTLWISSVSMNAQGISWGTGNDSAHSYSAYHSYWPVSSFMTAENMSEFAGAKSEGIDIQMIEPHFGKMADLKNLVDACHKRGIRVLVDFAANHVHKDSPMIKKHPDWINDANNPQLCDNNGNWERYSEKCWFSQDLPDINYDNPAARKAMVDHATYLIKETNIDGFRVDAVKHMNIQFIKDLRAATDKLYANSGHMFYMVGETFTGDIGLLNKYIGNDLLHAQFDFPMYYAINSHILGLGNYAAVAQLSNHFNSDLMGTFMGNHDVARAISVAAGQNQNKWCNNSEIFDWLPYLKIKTAWTILLTNPGVPLIYYGDEYGQEGCNDPDNRRMMKFDNLNDEQKGLLAYVQLLGQIRKEHPAITRGHRENLSYGGGYWCYKLTDGNENIIVGISRADGGDNSGCDLKGSYNLQNLLNPSEPQQSGVNRLDLSGNRLQVYLVK